MIAKESIKPHMEAKHMVLKPCVILPRLQWDQKKFGNVSVLRVYPNDLWLPDIELYNTKVRHLRLKLTWIFKEIICHNFAGVSTV